MYYKYTTDHVMITETHLLQNKWNLQFSESNKTTIILKS